MKWWKQKIPVRIVVDRTIAHRSTKITYSKRVIKLLGMVKCLATEQRHFLPKTCSEDCASENMLKPRYDMLNAQEVDKY